MADVTKNPVAALNCITHFNLAEVRISKETIAPCWRYSKGVFCGFVGITSVGQPSIQDFPGKRVSASNDDGFPASRFYQSCIVDKKAWGNDGSPGILVRSEDRSVCL